jgi:hypothetical protein
MSCHARSLAQGARGRRSGTSERGGWVALWGKTHRPFPTVDANQASLFFGLLLRALMSRHNKSSSERSEWQHVMLLQ